MFVDMKEGTWLLGGGWNNDLWGGELPSASWIDDITPHHPVRNTTYNLYKLSSAQVFFLSWIHGYAGMAFKDGWSHGFG